MNLFDIIIARKLAGGGGGNITVEPLSVTENDTYTAPTGKAYSPVTVNVSGGSSEFSTAAITVTISSNTEPWLAEPYPIQIISDTLIPMMGIINDDTYDIVLYQGSAPLYVFTKDPITVYSGAFEVLSSTSDPESGGYYSECEITGDCSFTLVGFPIE